MKWNQLKRPLQAALLSGIVGASVLFLLGTGTVKGFAYTLFWGTVFSLVTAVFVTRFFVDLIVERGLVTNPKSYGRQANPKLRH